MKKYYETGGGVVVDDEGRVLLLERHVVREEGLRHEIRLPKGHIDPGETPEQAALREVREESGYCDLEIVAPLGELTVHYTHGGEDVTRREFYFLMRLRSDDNPGPLCADPASEEALFEVRWARGFDEALRLLTYEGEREFARRAQARHCGT
jgi:8-oxo-dGTP pyrophosphatase MutT (NUDIX family)